jgi:hypothetical protein
MARVMDNESGYIALPAPEPAGRAELSHADPPYLAGGPAGDSLPAALPGSGTGGDNEVDFDDFAPRWWPFPPLS